MKIEEAIEILQSNRPSSDTRRCGEVLCEAVDVAIKACKKQVPKEPINDNCPTCKSDARNWIWDGPFNYCPYCGQALKLEEIKIVRTIENCSLIKRMGGAKPVRYNGKCIGFATSDEDDEPCDLCKDCNLNECYEEESE